MIKEKLSTFAANSKTVKVTMERKIVHIRVEQKLMTAHCFNKLFRH